MVEKAINIRKIPFSSRSAVRIIKDMIATHKKRSIYWDILDDVVNICKEYDVSLSLGAAFRPAVTSDTLDQVHIDELLMYRDIIDLLRDSHVNVMTEDIGHCDIYKLKNLISYVNMLDCPFMPLGPLFTDSFNNDDHLINAIGFYTAIYNGANFSIINSITPAEHSGGLPNNEDMLIGYKTARCCANICNEYLGYNKIKGINRCIDINDTFLNCNRCNDICPTYYYYSERDAINKWITSIH